MSRTAELRSKLTRAHFSGQEIEVRSRLPRQSPKMPLIIIGVPLFFSASLGAHYPQLIVAVSVCSLAISAMAAVIYLAQQTVVFSRARGRITITTTYLGFLKFTKEFAFTDVKRIFVKWEAEISEELLRISDLYFHPAIELSNGQLVRFAQFVEGETDKADLLVEAISRFLHSGVPATETAQLAAIVRPKIRSPQEVVLRDVARASAQRANVVVVRAMGLFILLLVAVFAWTMRVEFLSRYEAEVVGSRPECQYSWSLPNDRSETKISDCSSVPEPDIAPKSAVPRNYRGHTLEVRLALPNGGETRGNIFVTDAEARSAATTGKTTVVYDPRYSPAVRRPLPIAFGYMLAALLVMCALLVILGPISRQSKTA